MTQKTYNVLFICTWNSARSIMAEAILNQMGNGWFRAFSAGSHPIGQVNPQPIQLLQSLNYDTFGLRSKHWDEFIAPGAPLFDFIFTVCDKAAGEPCPVWPGQPMQAQWGARILSCTLELSSNSKKPSTLLIYCSSGDYRDFAACRSTNWTR